MLASRSRHQVTVHSRFNAKKVFQGKPGQFAMEHWLYDPSPFNGSKTFGAVSISNLMRQPQLQYYGVTLKLTVLVIPARLAERVTDV